MSGLNTALFASRLQMMCENFEYDTRMLEIRKATFVRMVGQLALDIHELADLVKKYDVELAAHEFVLHALGIWISICDMRCEIANRGNEVASLRIRLLADIHRLKIQEDDLAKQCVGRSERWVVVAGTLRKSGLPPSRIAPLRFARRLSLYSQESRRADIEMWVEKQRLFLGVSIMDMERPPLSADVRATAMIRDLWRSARIDLKAFVDGRDIEAESFNYVSAYSSTMMGVEGSRYWKSSGAAWKSLDRVISQPEGEPFKDIPKGPGDDDGSSDGEPPYLAPGVSKGPRLFRDASCRYFWIE